MGIKGKKSKYILEGKSLKIAQQMLKDVTDIFDKHSVRYWLDFGTLLGIVREGRILPWDDDMDISIFEEDRQKVHDVIMPEIKKLNYRTYSRLHKNGDDILKDGDFRTFKVRNYRWKFFKGYVKMDIFVMYKKDDFFYWREFCKRHKMPMDLLKEFDTIEFNGKDYTKPKDTDVYLTHHYNDWRVPIIEYDAEVDGLNTLERG